MKQAIGYLREHYKATILSSTKTNHRGISQNIIFIHYLYGDKQSGRTDKRNGYQQITELIQQGQCDVLCCYRLNRLHRNLKMH